MVTMAPAPAWAQDKPSPFKTGRYIGWLIACDLVPGSKDAAARKLTNAINKRRLWKYNDDDVRTLVKGLNLGAMGRGKWDNAEHICAKLAQNKKSISNVRNLLALGT